MIALNLPRDLSRSNRAFSLVELSIVLVILGLLVGGILSGKSLIRASELRKIPVQHAGFVAATLAFKDKYFMLPGDLTNATQIWGAAAAPASCATTQGTGTQTCDGDGNGRLELSAFSYEYYRFWQQLANAGLIEGSYAGILLALGNGPKGIGQSEWGTQYYGNRVGQADMFNGEYGNVLFNVYDAVTPAEAWGIDKKIDDGMPGSGKLVIGCVTSTTVGTCSTATGARPVAAAMVTAEYLISSEAKLIEPIFRNQF